MELQDILSVGLTVEDFETLMEGLDTLPEKGMGDLIMISVAKLVTGAPLGKNGLEEIKKVCINDFQELKKKAKSKEDDLIVLKSKLVLLKRLLLTNDSVRMANDILNKK
jgi:hypothetical protein